MKTGNKHKTRTSLRVLVIYFSIFLLATTSYANDGDEPSSRKNKTTEVADVSFHLKGAGKAMVDSALIILDRYDHTGAGVVIERVRVDEKHRLVLENVPAGKYYVGVYTYGAQREFFSLVIRVKKKTRCKRDNRVAIAVADAEWYQPGTAVIPAEDPSRFLYVRK